MATYGFIGLGLIAGSIARGIREKQPNATIIAFNRSHEPLEAAVNDGVVNIAVHEIGEEFRSCDYIFLCTPVQKNEEYIELIAPFMGEHTILTDVGSVKTGIHKAIDAAGLTSRFIGGHPMAGSERVGYVNSKSSILQNAYYILTPNKETPTERVEEYRDLVASLGSIPLILSYKQHDYIVAAISHLPHVIAASLVNLVRDSDSEEGLMKMVAAGGFKDITRIASSSAAMWQQICLTNTENISALLSDYIASLEAIKDKLNDRASDDLYNLFDEARIYRDSFTVAGSGPIKISYIITIDIADEPGALAAIATILALNGINIKNIGIIHNREYQGGDLKIEFYSMEDLDRATEILNQKGYTTHKKN